MIGSVSYGVKGDRRFYELKTPLRGVLWDSMRCSHTGLSHNIENKLQLFSFSGKICTNCSSVLMKFTLLNWKH